MKENWIIAEVMICEKERQNSTISIFGLIYKPKNKPRPGQFVVLKPLHYSSTMPRPFSVVYFKNNLLVLMINNIGLNTNLYCGLKKGDKIEVSEPKGKPFHDYKEDSYILVGGGVGAAGICFLAETIFRKRKKVTTLLGAKHLKDIVGRSFFKELGAIETIPEESPQGGLVTKLLNKQLKKDQGQSTIIACGPKPMLKTVVEMAEKYGNKCYLSMEEVMACGGTGACYGCVVPMKKGLPKRLCQDGPIFKAEEVDFSKIRDRSFVPLKKVSRPTRKPLEVVLIGREGKELTLSSLIMYASGCVDLETLASGGTDCSKVGAIVAKGIELKSRPGNPTPRVGEVFGGMLNSIGLQGVGIEKFVSKILPNLLAFNKPVITNISGSTVTEYARVAKKLSKTKVAAIEVNISCPNIEAGGMLFGQDAGLANEVVTAVREAAPKKFIIVKLTPNVTDIAEIARVVASAGADAVSLINTVQAMSIDVNTRRPKIANVMGGLSGPAIKPIGVRMVYQVARALPGFPIIGMGGIETAKDAAEYMIAGAGAVAVGTGLFKNPKAITEIYEGLLEWMKLQGANHISDLVGSLII